MRFPLDLVFLDREGRPCSIRREVPPRRLASDRRASAVLELPWSAGERVDAGREARPHAMTVREVQVPSLSLERLRGVIGAGLGAPRSGPGARRRSAPGSPGLERQLDLLRRRRRRDALVLGRPGERARHRHALADDRRRRRVLRPDQAAAQLPARRARRRRPAGRGGAGRPSSGSARKTPPGCSPGSARGRRLRPRPAARRPHPAHRGRSAAR